MPTSVPAQADDAPIARAATLCDFGRYLDAETLLPALETHPAVRARLLAARIVGHLGDRDEEQRRILRIVRAQRGDAEALLAMVRGVCYRRGPYRAWKFMRHLPWPDPLPPAAAADWHSLQAYVLGLLRDFERAQAAFRLAREQAPADPWCLVEWAYVCEQRDRYDEALAATAEALQLKPGYRAAIQARAHLLSLTGREEDALALLQEALAASQSATLAMQLFELQVERRGYAEAWATLDRCEHFLPRAGADLREWLAARRADVALHLGRTVEAREQALRAGGPFYARLAERLARGDGVPGRVELPVGFTRQHYKTCAPATLATLSRYWSRPASHLEITEAVCYDGTPNHSERRWAEQQGFLTREFTVDWDTARALLDAGVPFTLTTVYTGGAHLQAVIGYDALRGTLLIRDPFKRTCIEFDAGPLFESHRAHGPRGMALLPPEEAARIAAIPLPEAAIWDGYHAAMRALADHDRDGAVAAARALEARWPDHRMTHSARRAIASYDRDEPGMLETTEALLSPYPEEVNLQLAKAASLAVVASRAEQEEWWATLPTGPAGDPHAMVRYAQFLSDDGRELRRAARLTERAMAAAPTDPLAWYALANLLWQRGKLELALEHYRFAACLDEENEGYAGAYFRAARCLRQTDAGLAFLQQRVERLGQRSAGPACTLFNELETLERCDAAFQALEQALGQRPQDPELLLFAAEVNLRFARLQRAKDLLQRAEPLAKRAAWLRIRALWLRESGDPAGALAPAREAGALEPLNLAHHRLVAALLAQQQGQPAAVAYLRDIAGRHPHHFDLQHLLLSWLGADQPEETEAVLKSLLRINPRNAWAQRELAIHLAGAGRLDEAWTCARAALELAPRHSHTHSTLGFVRWREGRMDEARAHLRAAIVLSVDNEYAINTLIGSELALSRRREAVAFVREELVRQVTLGDGLLCFQQAAQDTLEPAELLALLEEGLRERADLWQAWAAVAMQLTRMDRRQDALQRLGEAIERFPLLPRLHVEQAQAYLVAGEREAARASLRRALELSPAWHRAVRLYVDTVADEGRDLERARPVLDAALARVPDNADLRLLRAWLTWRLGDPEAALAELRTGLALDPTLRWGWELLQRIAGEQGTPDLVLHTAQAVVARRPGDPAAWLRLADWSAGADEALAAVDKALAIEPRHVAAHEARLRILLEGKRHDELAQALAHLPWQEDRPSAVAVFEARLQRARGEADAALATLTRLVERDPNSFALWRELADWHDEAGRRQEYLQAAENLLRLAPHAAVACGYAGDAALKLQQRERALAHFRRALVLDPAYLFAGTHVADLCLEDGDADGAAQALDSLAAHHAGPALALRGLRLAILRRDTAAGLARLKDIFAAVPADNGACGDALRSAQEARWHDLILEAVEDCAARGPCARPAVAFWLQHQGGGLLPGAFYRDVRKAMKADPAHALKAGFLEWLGDKGERRLLDRFVGDFREVLQKDMDCWGMVGYAYLVQDRYRDTERWHADWRARPEAPAWALDNLAFALRQRGRDAAARDVSLQSLARDPGNADALTWTAVDAALAARHDELAPLLERIDGSLLRPYYRNLLTLLQSYLAAVQADDSRRAVRSLCALRPAAAKDPVTRRLRRALARRLLARHTAPLARPWRWLQFQFG